MSLDGRIRVPEEVRADLGLVPGDPAYFLKNEETNRWELRSWREFEPAEDSLQLRLPFPPEKEESA